LLDQIISWAQSQQGIRLVALVGSGARIDHPADEWSDIDLVLAAADPQMYLATTGWLADLGEVWFSYQERHFEWQEPIERRVLFAGGQDVDFIVPSVESARQGFAGTFLPEIAARGLRVLLDKDGLQLALPVMTPPRPVAPPSSFEFAEVVHDFWFHTVWTAKKLRRGELWMAKMCCDDYLKRLLLRMLEWQTRAEQPDADTWFNGRFLEQWASGVVLEKLRIAFAHYDEGDVWRGLRSTMDLFDQAAQEVARGWGYDYPVENVEQVIGWVESKHESPQT
jgi:aminoglycoside 6-adenylyltransferase